MTIKELRKEKKLSQAAFAQSIGVSAGAVGAYESGKFGPSKKTLTKIKEVYGVDMEAESSAVPVEKKPGKRGNKKKATIAEEKKTAKRGRKKAAASPAITEAKPTAIIIQSPLGGSITPEEILSKIGAADTVYIRVDENKAYWVRGEETGSVDLW